MNTLNNLCEFALEAIKDHEGIYTKERIIDTLEHIIRPNMNGNEVRDSLMQVSLELTTELEPKWQFVAARLYIEKLYDKVRKNRGLDKD